MTAKRRLVFGQDSAPVDPNLCVNPVRERWDDVLTETLCLHPKDDHDDGVCYGETAWPGGDRGPCPCERFKSPVVRRP